MWNRNEPYQGYVERKREDERVLTNSLAWARKATQRARERSALNLIIHLPVGVSVAQAQQIAREALR